MTGASDAGASVIFSGGATFDPPGSLRPHAVAVRAEFTISGADGARQLTILLTNTSAATSLDAPDHYYEVLTGPFFNLGTTAFTPASATIERGGSIVQTSKCDTPCVGRINAGGDWSDAQVGATFPSGANQGTSTGHLGDSDIAARAGNFDGPNLEKFGSNPDTRIGSIEFDIVPEGFEAGSGKPVNESGIDGEPLIEGTVKFVLNIPNGLKEEDLAVGGPSSVPEPAVLSFLGLALAGIGYRLRRPAGTKSRP